MHRKTVIIHGGLPKTATSALQSFFAVNDQQLLDHDILYPKLIGIKDAQSFQTTSGNAFFLAKSLFPKTHKRFLKRFSSQELWGEFCNIAQDCKESKVLLSSEFFANLSPNSIANMLQFLSRIDVNVKVVFYLRRQDQILQANYAQRIKQEKETRSIKEYFTEKTYNNPVFKYRMFLSKWERFFSKDNIIVRCFEKQQLFEHNIYNDFASQVLGITVLSGFIFPDTIINPSPRYSELRLLRELNAMNPPKSFTKAFVASTQQLRRQEGFSKVDLLSPEKRLEISEFYAEENRQVAREYFQRQDGKLFFDSLEDENWEMPDDEISVEDFQILVMGILIEQFKRSELKT